ncbi:MAG: hypothetical protein LBQ50_13410, partial [Planctomycetaceae bacterium]|nr:hypothetical protein [Planctomycetaceae bacterium]
MLRFLFFFLFLAITVQAAEVPFEITDADGLVVSGTIKAFDSVRIVLDSDGTETEILTEKLVKLQNLLDNPFLPAVFAVNELPPKPSNSAPRKRSGQSITALLQKQESDSAQKEETKPVFPEVVSVLELKDRTRLVVTDFVTKGKSAVCRLLNSEEITLPLEQLLAARLVVKGLKEVTASPEDWQKLAASSGQAETGDRIVVGQPGSLDIYVGILAEVGKETISFIVDGETLPVPRRKVFGLLFHSPQDKDKTKTSSLLPRLGSLTLWNGTIISIHSLKSDENGKWNWTSISGVSGMLFPEEIDELDLGQKNAFYLTDLKPVLLEQA